MLINTGTIPIIVVSSRTPIGNRDAALKAGAIAYIDKPVDIPVLLKAIHEALGISPPEPPPEPPQPPPPPQP
jgi:CheY-like chemotaxis protein